MRTHQSGKFLSFEKPKCHTLRKNDLLAFLVVDSGRKTFWMGSAMTLLHGGRSNNAGTIVARVGRNLIVSARAEAYC